MSTGEYKAYMTVEASFVVPLVMAVYIFILQYALWAYDRCMLEFDIAGILLRGAVAEETEAIWHYERKRWDKKKYTCLYSQEVTGERGAFTLKLTGRAESGSMLEDVEITYHMWNIEPEVWLRAKQKLKQYGNAQKGEEKP